MSHSGSEESSYENKNRKRLRKGEAKTKQRAIVINPDSENSSESEEHRQPTKSSHVTVDTKPVQLCDFVKIVLKRKDLAKWVEHEEYR